MLLLYILWDDWPISRISASNEQLQQQLEYTLLKPDCHCWWISKMQSGREDTLKNDIQYNSVLNLEKILPQKRMKCFRLLFDHHAWIEHHHSWLAKGLGLGLLCWGFKVVQEEIPWEEASTLEIGSVAFLPGQCTSLQLDPCHRLFDQAGHQDSSSASLQSRRWSLWLLVIP